MSADDAQDSAPPPPGDDRKPATLDRRSFFKGAAATAGIATVGTFWFEGFGEPARRRRIEPTEPGAPLESLTPEEYRTLDAIQDRLLPSSGPDDPGAKTVNATGYLDAIFASGEVSKASMALIRWGAARLAHRPPARPFADLDLSGRDIVLRNFVYGWQGENQVIEGKKKNSVDWVRKLLSYTLEAFFGDPVHGGNPDEVAWKWAHHTPGTPRPTKKDWKLEGR